MRKKCAACGLVYFAADEVCGRCGSAETGEPTVSRDPKTEKPEVKHISVPWWGYIIFLVVGVVIEFFALFPVLANIGWRHSAAAPVSDAERSYQFWAFVLHLPTVLVPWLLSSLDDFFRILYLFVPIAQIIFWTFFLAFVWKRWKALMDSS